MVDKERGRWFNGCMKNKYECEGCEEEKCQDCCEHNEVDHFICMDCEKEMDPGEAIDRAMDGLEDR
jgi:hypothetical protein